MSPDPAPTGSTQEISKAIAEISERAQVLIRDEIDLAKVEMQAKAKKIGTGAAVAAVAGVFVFFAIGLILSGLSWLAWYELFPDSQFFWGFFLVAGVLLVVAGLAGWFAVRALQTKPTPDMAIAEAHRIRETIAPHDPAPSASVTPPVAGFGAGAPAGVSVPPAGVSVPPSSGLNVPPAGLSVPPAAAPAPPPADLPPPAEDPNPPSDGAR